MSKRTLFQQKLEFNRFGHLTWSSLNSVTKKAMEQEFSWSGLTASLSIAFFVVIVSANLLNLAYANFTRLETSPRRPVEHRLELNSLQSASQLQSRLT